MWPGKRYMHPTYLDVVPTAPNLPPLSFPAALPRPARCSVQLLGASPSFAIRGVVPWGRAILGKSEGTTAPSDVLDCDPVRPGDVAILAESADRRMACVIPVEFRGGGHAQLFRGRIPQGGLQLSAPSGSPRDYVLYAAHGDTWKPLVLLPSVEESRLLLLSPGDYLVYGEERNGRATAGRFTVDATVHDVDLEPHVGANIVASAVLADGARLLGATVYLRVPEWDPERWVVALAREPGSAGLVVPFGRLGVRATQRSESSSEQTIVADRAQMPVQVRLGGSK
jgi:hypothetical protein